jgi:UDP-GlcNAc3NAcA epimerase
MHILHVVGARPHFPKLAPVSRALLARGHRETIVHTGQHYDLEMSDAFFNDLELPRPQHNLGIGSSSHGMQTGQMLVALEPVLLEVSPDVVLVYGDTNSTLAGAIAAAKLGIPVAHVEAGLRSYDKSMPEELNRILTDHSSTLLFCPTETATNNLAREGIVEGVHMIGDVMHDALLQALPLARERLEVLATLGVEPKKFVLATVHRAANTDDPARLSSICASLNSLDEFVVFPVHPRTKARIAELGVSFGPHVRLVAPLSYLEMLAVEENARHVLTDSGGVQKEAFLLRTPCVTVREETEWPETLADGWNVLAGVEPRTILAALRRPQPVSTPAPVFGDGHAAEVIVSVLESSSSPSEA